MIELRPVDKFHEARIVELLNDPEICRYNSHGVFPVTKPATFNKNTLRLAIFNSSDFHFIGVIALQKIDWVNRSAELAVLIEEPGQGRGKEASRLICKHGFDNLNLHRIYCGTHEANIGMQKVAESVGMVLEGRTRQAFYKHGEYADILHYGVLKEEFHAHFSHIERSGDQPADHPGGGEKTSQG